MKKIALVLLGVTGFAGSAFAADMAAKPVYKAPPPAPVYSWTGCYVGAGGGYGFFEDTRSSVTPAGALRTFEHDTGGRGWFGTVQGGCDYQFASPLPMFGNMVVGLFADGDWGSIKGNDNIDGSVVVASTGQLKHNESWAVGGRLGWLPSDRLLTFVSGGYTRAHWSDVNYTLTTTGTPTYVISPGWDDGWFIGTGYEYNLGLLPGLTWKTEYRYADYGSRTDTVVTNPGGVVAQVLSSHPREHTVRSELVWRFNWPR